MAKPSALSLAKDDIVELFVKSTQGVYAQNQLAGVLAMYRRIWHLPPSVATPDFIAFVTKHGVLRETKLRSKKYGLEATRYLRPTASPYEIAVSLKAHAYLSHGTAMILHGLTNKQADKVIYINAEQSEKPAPIQDPTQETIDRAFSNRQRYSKLIYSYGANSIVKLSGKQTKQLGVGDFTLPQGVRVPVTGVERTLIDIVVRPGYAGTSRDILLAYQKARDRVSVETLVGYLKKLGYVYPYHQAIGFLMERAGYPTEATNRLRALGLPFDFYLTHKMRKKNYSSTWRLFYPSDL
jgi:predicted transcriptional regulator of viral defense system